MTHKKPISLIIVGAGSRGERYAELAAQHALQARIVGVAEPRDFYREHLAREHGIPPGNVAADWRQLAERPRFADAIVIATPDALHAEPAVAFAGLGYHMLLEKPMAPTEAECRRIVAAVIKSGIIFSVCHVLLYTPYTRQIKALVASGALGEIVSIQRLEPVGYWHQAHSFVRGNWRSEAESSHMLLAKSCHDLDWIRHIMGVPCRALSSFGSLFHFRGQATPPGAGERCVACDYGQRCPYSAVKIYLGFVQNGKLGWPVNVLTPTVSAESVREALQHGPYGRCVYACDNDVVDNQVVNMDFQGGQTASFTMTAFTEAAARRTRIFGTRGELVGDGKYIHLYDFLSDETTLYDPYGADSAALGGHGGGDGGLVHHFLSAVSADDPGLILSGPQESLESHLMVFAAERARREDRVVVL